MLHADIKMSDRNEREFAATHVMESTNSHQNNQAINQLTRHSRQPVPILWSEGIIGMDRRRAK
jgi:hypothetical protein